jgi:ribosomal protein S27AE
MWHEVVLGREFFAALVAIDVEIALRAREAACPRCGGRLHAGHYERKPRGGRFAEAGEDFSLRFSWCCGREGCRKRTTPPSVRFLGRKVYLEGVILIACVLVPLLEQSTAAARRVTGIASRTLRRWHAWWQGVFVASALFTELRAHMPGIDVTALPAALVASFDGATPLTRLEQTMRFLAPLTTRPALATITELTGR